MLVNYEPTVPILPIKPSGLQAYRPITTYEVGQQPTETYISRGYLHAYQTYHGYICL